jgi:hypothetical protein
MESDPKAKINTDEEVKRLVQELKELEAQLDAKKDQIKATKAEKERKAREQDKDIEDVDVVEEKEKEEEKKEE